jgi:hypothetical protein
MNTNGSTASSPSSGDVAERMTRLGQWLRSRDPGLRCLAWVELAGDILEQMRDGTGYMPSPTMSRPASLPAHDVDLYRALRSARGARRMSADGKALRALWAAWRDTLVEAEERDVGAVLSAVRAMRGAAQTPEGEPVAREILAFLRFGPWGLAELPGSVYELDRIEVRDIRRMLARRRPVERWLVDGQAPPPRVRQRVAELDAEEREAEAEAKAEARRRGRGEPTKAGDIGGAL